jgi:hypothetical protein
MHVVRGLACRCLCFFLTCRVAIMIPCLQACTIHHLMSVYACFAMRPSASVRTLASRLMLLCACRYISNYMSKNATAPAVSLVLFRQAAKACVDYPSVAPDAVTDPDGRLAKQFLQKCVNSALKVMEFSGQMAAATVIGMPATFTSLKFTYLFVTDAVKHRRLLFDLPAAAAAGDTLSDTDTDSTDGDSDTNLDEPVVEHNNVTHGSGANVYAGVTTGGRAVGIAVPQHEHYAHRGSHPDVRCMSLWEYVIALAVVAISSLTPRQRAALEKDGAYLPDSDDKPGRKGNGVYRFGPGHQLYATHAQRILSKQCVPMAVGFPTCPMQPPDDAPAQRLRRHEAKRVCQMIALLTLHTNWSADHAEIEFDYSPASVRTAFTDWMVRLCSPTASFRDVNTREIVFNQVHGISNDAARRMSLRSFRARDADVITAAGLTRQHLKWPSFGDTAVLQRAPAPADDVDDAAVQAELTRLVDKHGTDAVLDMDKAAAKALNVQGAAVAAVERYFSVMGPAQRRGDGPAAGIRIAHSPSAVYTKDVGDGIISSLSKPLVEDTDDDLFRLDGIVEPDSVPAGDGQVQPGGARAADRLPLIRDAASIANRCTAAGLGVEQTAVATEVLTWAIADRDHAANRGPEPPRLRVLCLGGPGTGMCSRRPCLRARVAPFFIVAVRRQVQTVHIHQ